MTTNERDYIKEITEVNSRGESQFSIAIETDSMLVLKHYVEEFKVDLETYIAPHETTPLLHAISEKKLEIVKYFLNHGAKVDNRVKKFAFYSKNEDIMKSVTKQTQKEFVNSLFDKRDWEMLRLILQPYAKPEILDEYLESIVNFDDQMKANLLGFFYMNGVGFPRNVSNAFSCFAKEKDNNLEQTMAEHTKQDLLCWVAGIIELPKIHFPLGVLLPDFTGKLLKDAVDNAGGESYTRVKYLLDYFIEDDFQLILRCAARHDIIIMRIKNRSPRENTRVFVFPNKIDCGDPDCPMSKNYKGKT